MIKVVVVNEKDEVVGAEELSGVIRKELPHRVARVLVTRADGQMLLTRRSVHDRDNPGKWQQAVSGHVDEGETYEQAALREAEEEIGVTGLKLEPLEHYFQDETVGETRRKRFNQVFLAKYDGPLKPDPEEIEETRWVTIKKLGKWLADTPSDFTQGSALALTKFLDRHAANS